MIFWKPTTTRSAVLAIATVNAGSTVAIAKTANEITGSEQQASGVFRYQVLTGLRFELLHAFIKRRLGSSGFSWQDAV